MKKYLVLFVMMISMSAFAADVQSITFEDSASTLTITEVTPGASYTFNLVKAPDNCNVTVTKTELEAIIAASAVAIEE